MALILCTRICIDGRCMSGSDVDGGPGGDAPALMCEDGRDPCGLGSLAACCGAEQVCLANRCQEDCGDRVRCDGLCCESGQECVEGACVVECADEAQRVGMAEDAVFARRIQREKDPWGIEMASLQRRETCNLRSTDRTPRLGSTSSPGRTRHDGRCTCSAGRPHLLKIASNLGTKIFYLPFLADSEIIALLNSLRHEPISA